MSMSRAWANMQSDEHESYLRHLIQEPEVILSVYLLCVVPLGIYIFHDVLDVRWRRVQNLHYFSVLYSVIFVITVPVVFWYSFLNIFVLKNYTEGGTSLVVAIVAFNGGRKLFRLWHILRIHRSILEGPVTMAHRTLLGLFPRSKRAPGEGEHNFEIIYSTCFWKPHIPCDTNESRTKAPNASDSDLEEAHYDDNQSRNGAENDIEPRGHYFSAYIFDDDFPGGDSSRLKFVHSSIPFFHRLPLLVKEDSHECAMRLALYMRFALRPARFELWTAIVPTHRLVTIRGHISIGKVLRRLINGGSDTGPFYVESLPDDWDIGANADHEVLRDPVQHLLRFSMDFKSRRKNASDLKAIGASIFWIATQQNCDDSVTALSLFPKRWLRGARQNSRQLIFEICIVLMIAGNKMNKVWKRMNMRVTGSCRCSPDDLEVQHHSSMSLGSPGMSEVVQNCGHCRKASKFRSMSTWFLSRQKSFAEQDELLKELTAVIPILPTFYQTKKTSWGEFFGSEDYRKNLAIECSKAVSSFLVVPDDPTKHRTESTLFKKHANSPEFIPNNCERAFIAAFDRFQEKDVAKYKKRSQDIRNTDGETDGMFIGDAVQELLSTSKHAGMLADALIGPELQRSIRSTYCSTDASLQSAFGARASIRNAGIVFGLAAIVDRLNLERGKINAMVEEWLKEWMHDSLGDSLLRDKRLLRDPERGDPGDRDLFAVVKRMISAKYSSSQRSKLTGQEWLVRGLGDDKEYAERSCPDHVGAFNAYAGMAALLAEAVYVALCSWTNMPDTPRPPTKSRADQDQGQDRDSAQDATSRKTFKFPDILESPREMREKFMNWKRSQGRATAGSTFALMYNLKELETHLPEEGQRDELHDHGQ